MCANDPDFIDPRIPLAAAVFRLLLIHDNKPMSPRQMNEVITWKTPEMILTTLGGKSIFLGIRPA
jgi:K+-transporting ATPase c subunit